MGQEQKDRVRCKVQSGFLLLLLLLCFLSFLNLFVGSVHISAGELTGALLRREGSEASQVLWALRMPRLLAAVFLGGGLAVSGFLLQTFFANPIAGPYVLGISSGAKLMVAFVMVFSLSRGTAPGSVTLVSAAFLGAMLSISFILAVAGRVRNMSLLVICGVMIGYLCSAATEFVVTFAEDSNIVNLHNWSMGSFSGISMEAVRFFAPAIALLFVLGILLAKPMGAYQFGESHAESMGVNIRRFRLMLILLSGLLSALVTAYAGPVSFVGVAVPHLMKGLFRTAKPLLMLPACFLGGAVFCLLADLIARTAFAPTELKLSAVTSVLGAPIVIRIMLRRRGG